MNTETTNIEAIVKACTEAVTLRRAAREAIMNARLAYGAYLQAVEGTDWDDDVKDEQTMGLGDLNRAFRRIS